MLRAKVYGWPREANNGLLLILFERRFLFFPAFCSQRDQLNTEVSTVLDSSGVDVDAPTCLSSVHSYLAINSIPKFKQ